MKTTIHIGLLMLIVLSIFVFCVASDTVYSTVPAKNISPSTCSSINSIGAFQALYRGSGVDPCGPGSGEGQGPGGQN